MTMTVQTRHQTLRPAGCTRPAAILIREVHSEHRHLHGLLSGPWLLLCNDSRVELQRDLGSLLVDPSQKMSVTLAADCALSHACICA